VKNEHGVSNNLEDAEENLVGKNTILSLVSKYLQCKVVEEPKGSGKPTNAEKQEASKYVTSQVLLWWIYM
jgi:hypothetical protein